MNIEELKKVGYVNFGYMSPEPSSESTYPDYIRENVLFSIDKIKKHQTDKSSTFAFMTDIHYSSTKNHNIRTERLINAYKEIKANVNIDKLILGGDYINDGNKDYKTNNYCELRKFISSEKYFPVSGNHDDNSIWDLCIESEKSTNHLSSDELYYLFFDHLPAIGAKFKNNKPRLYYFYNDYDQRIRYIFLDTNDIPNSVDENGKLIYTKQHVYAISQEQLDWLLKEALVFDEDGWGIIFVAHTFYRYPEDIEKNKGYENLKVIGDVIDFYQDGKDLINVYCKDEFLINCYAEFSKYKRGHIIACFAGHHHSDFEDYTNTGVPIIYTGNVIMYRYAVPREDGNKSELLFDIVTIDSNSKTIYMTRIGAGNDREIRFN